MESEPLSTEAGPAAVAAALRRLVPVPGGLDRTVTAILAGVRDRGNAAVIEFTESYDTGGSPAPPLRVDQTELAEAEAGLDPEVREALVTAFRNVFELAQTGIQASLVRIADDSRELTIRDEPVRRAAVYVPGGRAPYPSTVVMGAAAAQAAGVGEVVVCSPPAVDSTILAACQLSGVREVYRMGGAQAIAALAYGTETVRAVDVIVGPGNAYVQEAKRRVSGVVGIDSFAGPSDLMVLVEGEDAELEWIALDLLAQAEHGPGTIAVAVSTSVGVIDSLTQLLAGGPATGAVIRLVHAGSAEDALALAEEFAPEHLQLVGGVAEDLAPRVTRAGCVFVGARAGTAFGDYIVGSNHILPTNGSARFASGLSVEQFRRRFTEVRIQDPAGLARMAAPLARAEGFELHARSMEARIRDNRGR